MTPDWKLVIHEPTLRFLLSCRVRERNEIFAFLQQLASNPYQEGEQTERDASGRMHQIIGFRRWSIAYWADHAVKELRVVRIERM